MSTSDPAAVVTSLNRPLGPCIEGEPKGKSFGQTVAEARRTLFEAARHPQQASTLTPGRRSVFDAFKKARKDIDAKARQNAGTPVAARDPCRGAELLSSRPRPRGPGRAEQIPTQVPGAELVFPGEAARPIEAPQPTNPPKRGLFGLSVQVRDSG